MWREEGERAREIVTATSFVDQTGIQKLNGQSILLRWSLVHIIAEYVRHNGHADLFRGRIDSATGYQVRGVRGSATTRL